MLTGMALAGALGGALWAGVCGALRVLRGTNELLSSLMLNYIGLLWVRYFVFGPWSEASFPLSRQFPKNAWLPRLFPSLSGVTVHVGLILALLAAGILGVLLSRSRFGFSLRVIGANPRAALHVGLPLRRHMLVVLLLSGGLAGLGGMVEVAGVIHRLSDRFSPGYGFTAIIVAWLAKLDPLAVVPVSILLGGLIVGGKVIQPAGIPQMLQGVILLAVVGVEMLARYRLTLRRESR
jgi:simple sugar transport system permease protein